MKPVPETKLECISSSGSTFKLRCRVFNAGFSPFKIQYITLKFFLRQMPEPLYADIIKADKYLRPGDEYINDEIAFDVRQMTAPELRSLDTVKDIYLRFHLNLLDLEHTIYRWPKDPAQDRILFIVR